MFVFGGFNGGQCVMLRGFAISSDVLNRLKVHDALTWEIQRWTRTADSCVEWNFQIS